MPCNCSRVARPRKPRTAGGGRVGWKLSSWPPCRARICWRMARSFDAFCRGALGLSAMSFLPCGPTKKGRRRCAPSSPGRGRNEHTQTTPQSRYFGKGHHPAHDSFLGNLPVSRETCAGDAVSIRLSDAEYLRGKALSSRDGGHRLPISDSCFVVRSKLLPMPRLPASAWASLSSSLRRPSSLRSPRSPRLDVIRGKM